MPRAEEFDAFYAQTRSRLLHVTYALTGDLGAAAAALRDAFARAWQHWHRLRARDAEAWVRQEAGRLATLRHSAHLRRRLDDTGADTELLEALQALPATGRRLVLLQTLGDLDLAAAAREVATTDEDALEATDAAVHRLTSGPDAIDDLEGRLAGLHSISERVAMPRAAAIRRQGRRRQRRTTLAAVAASVAVVVGAGFLVAAPAAETDPQVAMEKRKQIGETPPEVAEPEPPGAGEDQLMNPPLIATIDPPATWRVARNRARDAMSPCQTAQYADPRVQNAAVRTFRADSRADQQLVQTVEVSRNKEAATRAYEQMIDWYASCQEPRMQLVDAYRVPVPGTDVQILSMRAWDDPTRSITVSIAQSGIVTTRLVHEVARPDAPGGQAMAVTTRHALTMLCTTSRGSCGSHAPAEAEPPPPSGEGPGFLAVVDLPPVGDLDTAWAGTQPVRAQTNPAATLCDQAEFTGSDFVRARARTFVMPRADVAQRFGISQTLGELRNGVQAQAFLDQVAADVDGCEDRELSASVESLRVIDDGPVQGRVWELSFEIGDGTAVAYRLGIVKSGSRVAQVSFSGTDRADVDAGAFADLVERAGERLGELGRKGGPKGATGGGAGA